MIHLVLAPTCTGRPLRLQMMLDCFIVVFYCCKVGRDWCPQWHTVRRPLSAVGWVTAGAASAVLVQRRA